MCDKQYEEIKKLSTADIVHLMIANFDKEYFHSEWYHCASNQNSVYVNCHSVLEDRFKKIDEAL